MQIKQTRYIFQLLAFIIIASFILYGCNSSADNAGYAPPPPEALPVITVSSMSATTYQEYSASLEGSKDIQVRPQIDGYIEKIFVDEGAHVRKGQALFQINSNTYQSQLNNAKASLIATKANLVNAQINVSKLTPLVQNNVISDVQLKTAQSAYDAAAANVSQAEAVVKNAEINLGYTMIKAPVDGYIGRIPHKTGSLVGTTTPEPLTIVSEINKVYVYFSLSENDFFQFKNQFPGKTVEEKIKQVPPVELVLSDGSVYPEKGKVEIVSGQFSNTIGAISFRASFENKNGLLRSGNTGKVRIPRTVRSALIIPQEATFELQDKVFVFAVGDSSKVTSKPLTITGTSGNYYLVQAGIKEGEKIVYTGLDRLRDGAVIQAHPMSMDSLLKARPM
ncbi:MAG: efflux RND transporter periplasmic adaptor subunit [Ferruginibacter sp.]